MTLQQLRDLVAVVEHGGFRSAARALDVSQGGLTRSLAKFEEKHGVTLIDRNAKGIALTAVGEEFFRQAQALLLEAERTEEWLHRSQRSAAASVSLGVSIEPSLKFIPSVLRDYRRNFPEVALFLTQSVSSELLAGLRENRLEFAVTRLPNGFEAVDMQVDVLCESESVIVARVGHPCSKARSVVDLAKADWVMLGEQNRLGINGDSIVEMFQSHQLGRPRIAAITDSLFGAISMVVQSDCLARLPKAVLQHPLSAHVLVAVPLAEPAARYRIALVQKSSHRLSREAHALAAMLASFARISRALP